MLVNLSMVSFVGICKTKDGMGHCIVNVLSDVISARIWAVPVDSSKATFNIFYMENRFLKSGRVYVKINGNVSVSDADDYMMEILRERIAGGGKPLAYRKEEFG